MAAKGPCVGEEAWRGEGAFLIKMFPAPERSDVTKIIMMAELLSACPPSDHNPALKESLNGCCEHLKEAMGKNRDR